MLDVDTSLFGTKHAQSFPWCCLVWQRNLLKPGGLLEIWGLSVWRITTILCSGMWNWGISPSTLSSVPTPMYYSSISQLVYFKLYIHVAAICVLLMSSSSSDFLMVSLFTKVVDKQWHINLFYLQQVHWRLIYSFLI